MSNSKSSTRGIDWELANQLMDKAVREGRTEDDGFWDYLATLGITRPEENRATLQRILEEDRQLSERMRANLEQMEKLARAAQRKYSRV